VDVALLKKDCDLSLIRKQRDRASFGSSDFPNRYNIFLRENILQTKLSVLNRDSLGINSSCL
jgi:hypothetical protein